MSLTKLGPSGWRYFAEEIATGREDYFARSAEHPGRYLGRGAEAIGLAGAEVDALGLERLIGHGTDPRDGAAMGRGFSPDNDNVVAGFGLTFSPPKSVSVLWGTGGEELRTAVVAAHERAVASTLSFLQDHAAFTRRGAGGVFQVDTEGFVAASFLHRTSRAADPQLHSHVLLANKVRAEDGRWLSLDGRELYEHQKAAGMLYRAALRAELTASLKVSWMPVDENGIAEIQGVPEVLVEAWSTRRHEVESLGAELVASRETELGRELSGGERARCLQLAAYRSRAPKLDAETPTEVLVARWREEAASFGQAPERWLPQVLSHARTSTPEDRKAVVHLAIARLEETRATWGRSDVTEVLTTLLTGANADELRARVEELADEVLGDHRVCSLAAPLPAEPPDALRRRDGMSAIERHGATRYTTEATLRSEARVLDAVAKGRNVGVGLVPERTVDMVLSRSMLGADQQGAVRELLGGGEQVALLVGPAGAGKSRALGAAREAWDAAGYRLTGLAPSAIAARVLSDEAGLCSDTLARFLLDVENGRRSLGPRDVVVLDEATMTRTDDLERLVTHTAQVGCKLVLAGDPHQLGAVGPGGLFATLVGSHGASELETVRRFLEAWEAQASLRLRARDVSVLAEYVSRGRVVGGREEEMRAEAFALWRRARDEGRPVLLMAGDNATVDALGRRCREDLVARGEVEREGAPIANGRAGVGDEIVTLKNDRKLRWAPGEFVRNGERWRVVKRDLKGALTVEALQGRGRVTLPPQYVAEHVALGYALTVHKAQGSTLDRGIVLVDEQMTAQQLYVAMSRGREMNTALVVEQRCDPGRDVFWRSRRLTSVELLANVMRRDGAERSAHDVARENLAHMEDIGLLGHLLAEARRDLDERAGPDRNAEIIALRPRADVQRANQELKDAQSSLRCAGQDRERAETALVAANTRPTRALLPGLLGNEARRETEAHWQRAKADFDAARRIEQQSLRTYERARHRLEDAERAARQLSEARTAQERRQSFLREHPGTRRWIEQLEERVAVRDYELARTETSERPLTRDGRAEQTPGRAHSKRAKLEASPAGDAATRAVLARASRHDPGHRPAPMPLPRPMEREGPNLGQ
jgi:conjugative relaxase-like TrwC/TraI family protein